MRTSECVVDLGALRHNLHRVRTLRPKASIMAMVKANAYGHGLIPAASALADADALGVAFMEEALQLRAAGIVTPIALLEGVFSPAEMQLAAEHRFHIVIHQEQQLRWLLSANVASLKIWVKVNTGMNRLGFRPEDLLKVWTALKGAPQVGQLGLMTHLACADEMGDGRTQLQLDCFARCQAEVQLQPRVEETSLANSAAILGWPQAQGDWVRPGLMLYGTSPLPAQTAASLGLRPVMSLRAAVMAVQDVKADETVGYGCLWTAHQDQRVALVNFGYGDGYPRTADASTPIAIAGRRYRLAGRVSMDMLAVDIGQDEVALGAPVELWGNNIAADEVASAAATLAYELFCKVTARVPRRYLP
ncbi:MAG: alanine racemase [Pseudomonadales bacterium]|nr:alanine racemase [Pseudomonadales bacterium]